MKSMIRKYIDDITGDFATANIESGVINAYSSNYESAAKLVIRYAFYLNDKGIMSLDKFNLMTSTFGLNTD